MTPYYTDDWVTIWHADAAEILPTIEPSMVGLLLTDPPYGINIDTNSVSRGRRQPGREHPPVRGDDQPFDPTPLLRFSRLVLWGANNYADKLPISQSWIVWNRLSGDSNTADAELAWSNLGGTVRSFDHLWNGVLRGSEIGFHVHPTQKPVVLMAWIIDRWSEPGDLILDPYMGSGPVAEAAKAAGRRYIGIELDEKYCEIAAKRCAQEVLDFGGAT